VGIDKNFLFDGISIGDSHLHVKQKFNLGACLNTICMEAVEKCLDARRTKSRGMRRTYEYAAMTKDECNAADGRFPTASFVFFNLQ
jgi:hypothetical protein